MNTAIEVKNNIWWVGANDRRTHRFENYWPLPKGVAYNAYVVKDEKIALIDTIEQGFLNDYLENIETLCDGASPEYLVINHMEPDHSGSIKAIISRYPEITLVGNAKTFPILNNYYGSHCRTLEVKEGCEICLGSRLLTFYMAPMLHWPETMVTYIAADKLLFSGDIFGAFGTLDGGIFDDELDLDYLEEEISRYYSNIVGKYGMPAQNALKKLAALPIETICATHGPIWRSHIADIVEKYDKWSRYATEPGVVIAFSSMYGHTEKMADLIARYLRAAGIRHIRIYDTSETHPSYIINDIFRYKGVILGSPAYNGHIYPTMETLLNELAHMGIKNHYVAFFANKTWGGGALKHFKEFAEAIKWEVVDEPCEAWGEPKECDADHCRRIAEAMAAKLLQS